MISLRTNVDSLNAQMNLKNNSAFQSKTINQLTSGYRINQSGDDAAGLAIANAFRSNIAELQQGVANANDGVGQLQIVDGGLNNISNLLDRMKTLATQSASGTFTGNRATLNQEYSALVSEITRQASNINLNNGGKLNTLLTVYIGGANSVSNAGINVDLSGSNNAVDATSLNLAATNILGGGVAFANSARVDAPGATFVKNADETFTFNVYSAGASVQKTISIAASATGTGLTGIGGILDQFNSQLVPLGITAGVDGNGKLQFSGSVAFTASATGSATAADADLISSATDTLQNTVNYVVNGQSPYSGTAAQGLTFQTAQGSTTVSLAAGDTIATAISKINAQTATKGVSAILNAAGTGIDFQSAEGFSVNASAAGVFAAAGLVNSTAPTVTAAAATSNAEAAISALNAAVQTLGLVQGRVGAGENKLQYAISLAQSQISSFSAAESQIRDADVAAQAANLTKSQVLQQTSIAAMAQANQIPQSVLKLLQ